MHNYKVIQAFLHRRSAHNQNLKSTGLKLYSYYTVIAQHYCSGIIIVNPTHYTQTTTRHLNLLKIEASLDYFIDTEKPISKGCNDLIPYINKKWKE